jgi:hypothetical protein
LCPNKATEELVESVVKNFENNLIEFKNAFPKAKGSLKKRLLTKLLKQVVLSPQGLHIFIQLADGVEIPQSQIKLIRFENKKGPNNPIFAITKKAVGDDSNLEISSSSIDKWCPTLANNRTIAGRGFRSFCY